VLPQAAVVAVVEAVVAVLTRHRGEASGLLGAWWWNFKHLGQVRQLRRKVKQTRAVPDSEVRRLQVRGSVRASRFIRHRLHPEDRARAFVQAGQQLAGSVERGPARVAAILLCLLAAGIVVGTRHLLGSPMPAVGELAPLPGAGNMISQFVHGWRNTGMGAVAAVPPAFAAMGMAGGFLLGHVAILQKILVLGMIPVGAFGAWRLARRIGSTLGRLVLTIAYLVNPLPYNAVANGRWSGLIAYAAAPWLLGKIGRLCRLVPFVSERDQHRTPEPRSLRLEILGFGLALAPVLAFAPSVALALALVGVGLVAGSVLVGGAASAIRALVAAAMAVGVSAVLLFPWAMEVLAPGNEWSTIAGVARSASRAPGLGALMRFQVGPIGAAPLGWLVLVAAALPLIVGEEWRFAWAVRLWSVAIVCFLVAWAGARDWIPLHMQSPEVLLAPAAIALAAAAALGATAYELDIRVHRFGWRQVAFLAVGFALIVGAIPVLGAARDGRWGLTPRSVARSLSWMTASRGQGAFRVLWVGDPAALPVAGWPLGGGAAYATSRNGPPVATDNLPGPPSGATEEIRRALADASRSDTSRLGRLLAPMGVRYIVVPASLSTGGSGAPDRGLAPPASLTRGLASQIDLRLLPSDPATIVYENTAWGPGREVVPAGVAPAGAPLPAELGRGADLSSGVAVLRGSGPVQFAGRIPSAGQVLVSETPASEWKLSAGGEDASRQTAFGVANGYTVSRPGHAVLSFHTPLIYIGALLVQAALWVFAIRALLRRRRVQAPEAPPGRGRGSLDAPLPPSPLPEQPSLAGPAPGDGADRRLEPSTVEAGRTANP
jgi:hypothetical protein